MKTCPLGHTCSECIWNVHLRGMNPQSGSEIDQANCAIAWIPILLIENSGQQRQTAAAVESFRESMRQQNDSFTLSLMAGLEEQKRLGNDS